VLQTDALQHNTV